MSEKVKHLFDAFNPYVNGWIFTANGASQIELDHFRDWALPMVIAKAEPEEILAAFEAEVQRNASIYVEVSPIFGVKIDRECRLAEGVKLVPAGLHGWWWDGPDAPRGTCFLCQSFQVKPAFEVRAIDGTSPRTEGITKPDSKSRETVRHRIRLACLLASPGAVELPISVFDDDESLFVTRHEKVVRPMAALPLVSFPADEALVKAAFDHLVQFQHPDNLARAIDRLGRARLASSPVDRALELGIAAEIALMHDENTNNTEIAHKIGSRAAWLLGDEPAERANIFAEMKLLYQARSQAVHSGVLSTKSRVNLDVGDKLVSRALTAILARGHFPNWSTLVMGGNG